MTAVVFGDFLDLADQRLQAATQADAPITDPVPAARWLLRVVAALGRYLEDCAPVSMIEAMRRVDLQPWERAAIDASMAVGKAAECLERVITIGGQPPGVGDELAHGLDGAATALAAGRDLLQTHLTTTADGELPGYRSPWAPVVTSVPVTRALTSQVAHWSRPLARITAQLASASGWDAQQLAALQQATEYLWWAGAARLAAQAADPATADDRRLLCGIPAAHNLARQSPTGTESVAELAAGIAVSGERLREMVMTPASNPLPAPATADRWQWTARAAAITGHASELTLRTLAAHPASPLNTAQLQTAIDAVATSWAAWRQVGTLWAGITTQTRGHTSSATTEIGDLMIRIGRLAWDDPGWAPARRYQATLQAPASLAHDSGEIAAVVAAVHEAADAVAFAAAADQAAVKATGHAGRLYVTTRSLPDGCDVPRAYATAPQDRTEPLLDAYQAAKYASADAARSLATLALAIDAPSSVLALARGAATQRPTLEQALPPEPLATGRAASPKRAPGPVELALRHEGVIDPLVLLHAVAIDHAAQRLISHARQTAGQDTTQITGTPASAWPQPLASPVRLAAKDSPRTPREALAGRVIINASSRPRPRPGNRRRPQ